MAADLPEHQTNAFKSMGWGAIKELAERFLQQRRIGLRRIIDDLH